MLFMSATVIAAPYTPQSANKYKSLKKIYPYLSQNEISESYRFAADPANKTLVNDVLVNLKYRNLIKQTSNLPPIYFIFSQNNKELFFLGGLYNADSNIIVFNANSLYTNPVNIRNLSYDQAKALDFVILSSILSHELTHYEDEMAAANKNKYDSVFLIEKRAYRQTIKVIDSFLKMDEGVANDIPVNDFYVSLKIFEDFIVNMRKNYVTITKAAEAIIKNESQICKTLNIDEDFFKHLGFLPEVQFNAKNGGHIVIVEAAFANFRPTIRLEVNTISENVKVLNGPKEIAAFNENIKDVKIINNKIYVIKEVRAN